MYHYATGETEISTGIGTAEGLLAWLDSDPILMSAGSVMCGGEMSSGSLRIVSW